MSPILPKPRFGEDSLLITFPSKKKNKPINVHRVNVGNRNFSIKRFFLFFLEIKIVFYAKNEVAFHLMLQNFITLDPIMWLGGLV